LHAALVQEGNLTGDSLPAFDLTGRTAIVTGGNGGIGKGIAEGLARAGANLVIAARDEAKTAARIDEFHSAGHSVAAVRCDVSVDGEAERAVQFAVETFGSLRILVNNAAHFDGARGSRLVSGWDAMFRTKRARPVRLRARGTAGDGRRRGRQDHQHRLRRVDMILAWTQAALVRPQMRYAHAMLELTMRLLCLGDCLRRLIAAPDRHQAHTKLTDE
jgi:NAD(P)-dependent dehydrogenase (short-subunit alcohol dehydrogenase family)